MSWDSDRQVVVTGLGVISSIGLGKDAYWQAVVSGRSGASQIDNVHCPGLRPQRACQVKDLDPARDPDVQRRGLLGRASGFALIAGREAWQDAALADADTNPLRIGISFGTTGGEIQIVEALCRAQLREQALDSRAIRHLPCHGIPNQLARFLNAEGPQLVFPNACAAGNYAIGYAHDLIKSGRADIVVAGGVEAFSEMALIGFARLKTVAPEECRPFDKDRRGILLGEGAGVLVLEEREHAARRGVRPYAEIAGYGISCDAHHVTSPDPSGRGMQAAMRKALQSAGCDPWAVQHISAHGSGTSVNDRVETRAIRALFGDHADKLLVSSIKGMIGHTMGAASAIEAVTCALAVRHGVVPPTINYQTRDPDCDLDYVPNTARTASIEVAMNNAFAFGGKNTSVVLRREGLH